MSFNVERMRKVRFMAAQLNDAVTIHMVCEPKNDISRFIPQPLAISSPARFHFALNHFRKTNLTGVESYMEAAIIIEVEHNGEKGNLCLALILDDDNAMIGGREFFGFPKKLGVVNIQTHDENISGHVERRKTVLAEFSARVGDDVADMTSIAGPFGNISYNIKCFPSCDLRSFDYPPRLIKHKIGEKVSRIRVMKNPSLTLRSSPYDPWGEMSDFNIIDAYLREYDSTVLSGEVVAELDGNEYFKYALNRFI